MERRRDLGDGRALLVHITEAGRRIGRSRHDGRTRRPELLPARVPPGRCGENAEELPALTCLADLAQHRP
ncbi:hypothetical protein [Streptomyces mirabilis]|uniref:hypothetical protein n=1 Tax=Streptomyces mirabilis TaxID=68239 RepID=UPI0031BA41C0